MFMSVRKAGGLKGGRFGRRTYVDRTGTLASLHPPPVHLLPPGTSIPHRYTELYA